MSKNKNVISYTSEIRKAAFKIHNESTDNREVANQASVILNILRKIEGCFRVRRSSYRGVESEK